LAINDLPDNCAEIKVSEASPQTDELAGYMTPCLMRSDAGFWMLDSG